MPFDPTTEPPESELLADWRPGSYDEADDGPALAHYAQRVARMNEAQCHQELKLLPARRHHLVLVLGSHSAYRLMPTGPEKRAELERLVGARERFIAECQGIVAARLQELERQAELARSASPPEDGGLASEET